MSLQDASPLAIAGFIIIASGLIFLQVGYFLGRRKKYNVHYPLMAGALAFNSLFLLGYIVRFAIRDETHFAGPQWFAYFIYYPILIIHIILAIVVIILCFSFVPATFKNKGRDKQGAVYLDKSFRDFHRKRGLLTYRIWTFTFSLGILIFVFLYLVDWTPLL